MGGYEFQRAELDALEGVVRDPTAEPMSLTLPLLRHITNDFSHESRIGRGGFAVVYLGVLPSGLRIAVKRLSNIAYMNESAFQNEVFITMKATHKNTVRFMGYCSQIQRQFIKHHGRHVYAQLVKRLIFVEYAPKGTLDAHIGN
uniref:Protein kinase domain-containing protein n=1 Tax=Aegilops tauschii subsp. strangulata TaxID=200361 RepID=A0A452XSM9_AEGTS